jgi:hypothetical protein
MGEQDVEAIMGVAPGNYSRRFRLYAASYHIEGIEPRPEQVYKTSEWQDEDILICVHYGIDNRVCAAQMFSYTVLWPSRWEKLKQIIGF